MNRERGVLPSRRVAKKARAANHARGNAVRLALGAAALSGPLVWAGHVLLHWTHAL
jgi:hypothetical protein